MAKSLPLGRTPQTFIIGLWRAVFRTLGRSTLLAILRHLPVIERNIDWVTELYVVAGVGIAFVALGLTPNLGLTTVAVGIYRVFELIVVQVNVVVFDAGRVRGHRRLFILAAHNFVEVWVWFAVFFRAFADAFTGTHFNPSTYVGSLYFSLVTLATVGYGDIVPVGPSGALLITAAILTGMFFVLVLFARVVAMLPERTAIERDE